MSAGAFFRASVRRQLVLPPGWIGRARSAGAPGSVDWPDAPLPEEFEMPDEGVTTADHGGGRIGSAAEVTSGASSGHQGIPANVDLRHTSSHPPAAERGDRTNVRAARSMPPVAKPRPVGEKIDLLGISSEMDRRAARAVAERTAQVQAELKVLRGDGLAACKCGAQAPGATSGLVPEWFGRDCIERDCQLKVPA